LRANIQTLLTMLGETAGADALRTDADSLELYGTDVYSAGRTPLAVFSPDSVNALARGIGAATNLGIAIIPRGGGMSYTGGYQAPHDTCLIVDIARLTKILDIDEGNMTVTVEAGVTWKQLYERLAPLGLRARCWGTLSGANATIGGGMSQNGMFWGTGAGGSLVDGAVSFDVVLADGTIVSTGSPFFRPYGPDITGLFGGDCGALGVKARVTLRMSRIGAGKAYGSFAFQTADSFFRAMGAIAREGVSTECFGFDPFLQSQRMKRDSLANDAKGLLKMMGSQGSVLKGLREGAKVALAGRSFLDGVPFSMHCIAERRTQEIAASDMAEISRLVAETGGKPIENTIPKMVRADPFPPVNAMVGPNGERWAPIHGLFRNSELVEAWTAISDYFDGQKAEMDRHGVNWGALLAAVNQQSSLIEPCLYWPDALLPIHHKSVDPGHMAKLRQFPANPDASAYVHELRKGVIDVMARLGAVHFQIGRSYPLHKGMDAAAWSMLRSIKDTLDPRGLMNPGSLGLQKPGNQA
jgi:glycolate oxidase